VTASVTNNIPQKITSNTQQDTMLPAQAIPVPTDFLAELDRNFQVWLGALTAGISPASVGLAYADWLMHLSMSPGKVMGLWFDGIEKTCRSQLPFFHTKNGDAETRISPPPKDKRFDNTAWDHFPFNVYRQSFLSLDAWWQAAVINTKGVSQHHIELVDFMNHQVLNALSPSNFVLTNPHVLTKIQETCGQCLADGLQHFIADYQELLKGELSHHLHPYSVGKDLAISPGKVIYRNALIELIQYSPATAQVYAEPVLIVPAWIMKYYILDLTPDQSLVEYLVGQGHTVFLISWKNPTQEDRDLGLNDYMKLSVIEAIDVISSILPNRKIHATGYCIGGILLAIAAAWLKRQHDERLQSITLLAAQTDFDKAGELSLFTDESQLAFLDNIMQQQGYLTKFKLKSIFQFMHGNDLIWSYWINHYLLGERPPVSELMAWSADVTRMPYKMHQEYLEKLYLHDELAEGEYKVDGKEVALDSLTTPIFCVATEKDYLSPWRSVYKLHLLTHTEITFVLTNGGHNAGIVSALNNHWHHYRLSTTPKNAPYITPDEWLEKNTKQHPSSWWPAWHQWLAEHSQPSQVAPPSMGNHSYPPLCNAPGTYVFQQ
jgi:polyhydroxyalkanoate synthase